MKVKRLKEILREFPDNATVVVGEEAGELRCIQTTARDIIPGCYSDLREGRWEFFGRKLNRNKKAKYVLLGSLKPEDDWCHLSG